MSFRDRMKKKKNGLKKRHNTASKPSGGRFPTVYQKDKIPEGIKFFVCKEDDHIVDILPWEAGPDMPFTDQDVPVTKEGDFDYVLDIFIHQNVGKMKVPFVCPYENFGLPCPICEYIKANRLPKDEWSKKRAKRRAVYLIWNRTNAEEEKKGVQIFDVAHFFMEEKLEAIAKLPRGGGYVTFSDPDEGKSIAWTRSGSGMENTQYLGHRFIDREAPIPDRILDQTFALDSIVNMHPTYEEIDKAYKSADESAEPESETDEEPPFEEDIEDDQSDAEPKSTLKPKKKVVVKRKVRVRPKKK